MFKQFWKFIKNIVKTVVDTLKEFVVEVVQNIEGVVILSAASIGVTAVVSRYAMTIVTPSFISTAMVIPVLSVLFIFALTVSMQYRLAI